MKSEVQDSAGEYVAEKLCVLPSGAVTGAEVAAALRCEFVMWSCDLWMKYKNFGLPHGAGWAHERALTIRVLELWESVKAAVERRALEHH